MSSQLRNNYLAGLDNIFSVFECYPNGFASLPQLLSHLNGAYNPYGDTTYCFQYPETPSQCYLSFIAIAHMTLHPLMAIAYRLQQSHLFYRLQPSNIPLLPTATYRLLPSCGNQQFPILKANTQCTFLFFFVEEMHNYYEKGSNTLCKL